MHADQKHTPTVHPTVLHLPTFNTMAMFTVLPGKSFHAVQVRSCFAEGLRTWGGCCATHSGRAHAHTSSPPPPPPLSPQEVLAEDKPRMSISGWYHAPTEPEDIHLASLQQLQAAAPQQPAPQQGDSKEQPGAVPEGLAAGQDNATAALFTPFPTSSSSAAPASSSAGEEERCAAGGTSVCLRRACLDVTPEGCARCCARRRRGAAE